MSSPTMTQPTPSSAGAPPRAWLAVVLALACAACTFTDAALVLFDDGPALLAALDFNAGLFEDFLGPYWETSRRLVAGESTPAPGYLYPSTLAWLLAPFVVLETAWGSTPAGAPQGAVLPSWAAVVFIIASFAVLCRPVFALLPPTSLRAAAAAGAAFGLAHAPIHGAYWAQASLPAIAALAAAFALIGHGRLRTAGVVVGFAAALKLHPLVGCIALMVPWRPAGLSLQALGCAVLSAVGFGVLGPMALMGPGAWAEFHGAAWEQLSAMGAWVLTEEGSRGAQDWPALLHRTTGMESAATLRILGALLALPLVYGAARCLRTMAAPDTDEAGALDTTAASRSRILAAFVFIAATPWAAVSPTWPHGLLWVPAAWWFASQSASRCAWALAGGSFAAGSLFALRAAQSPSPYAFYGLPAWSAGFALAATVTALFSRDQAAKR